MNTNDRSLTEVFHGFEAMIDARTEDGIDRAWKSLPSTKRESEAYEMGRKEGLFIKQILERRIRNQRRELALLNRERAPKSLSEIMPAALSEITIAEVMDQDALFARYLQAVDERDRAIEERDRITRLWDRKSGMI